MQAKDVDVCSGVLFWTACTRRTHVLSMSSRCETSDSWRQLGSVKTAKKSWTVPQCGHVTLNCVQMASKQANVEFSSHIFQFTRISRRRCHAGTAILRLRGHTLQICQVVGTVRHRISCCAPTIHWKCDARMQNWQIKSPPALWKHLSFEYLGVIVALNGKSSSMLLEPTKISWSSDWWLKKVWISATFSR